MASKWEKLCEYALSMPGAREDHPWGETVAKVNNKVFVFLGTPEHATISVKLDESHGQALLANGAAPTGYGLGRSGWVSVPVGTKSPPVDVLRDWIEESYRIVAPKKLVDELDQR